MSFQFSLPSYSSSAKSLPSLPYQPAGIQNALKMHQSHEMPIVTKPRLPSFAQLIENLPVSPMPENNLPVEMQEAVQQSLNKHHTPEVALEIDSLSQELFDLLKKAKMKDMAAHHTRLRGKIYRTLYKLATLKLMGMMIYPSTKIYNKILKYIPGCDVKIHYQGHAITMDLINNYHKIIKFEDRIYKEFGRIFIPSSS